MAEPKTNELPIPNPPRIPPGFGRIVRDEAGKVISIEVNEEDQTSVNGKDIEMNMEQLEPSVDVDALSKWTIGGIHKQDGREEIGKPVIGGECRSNWWSFRFFGLRGICRLHWSIEIGPQIRPWILARGPWP